MKILAIDDKRDNLTVLKAVLLDRLPHVGLLTAQSGPEGLDLAAAEDPDVILLDIVMPDMDGYDVCRRLKADSLLKTIPVLFLTAHTDRDTRIKAVEAGADGFLSKPFDELELSVQILAMSKLKAASRQQRLEKEHLAALVAERTRELERELAERKQAEERARKEQALTDTIIESIPGTFYMLDKGGHYVRWNAFQRDEIIGRPSDLVDGMNALDTIHPDDREFISSKIADVLEHGKQETVVGRVLMRGGPAYRWLLMTGRQLMIDGSPYLLGIGIDITDRKEMEIRLNEALERAELASRAKSEFLAVMSHELRTPLNGVLGYAELLACSPLNDEQREYARTITRSGDHLLGIVNDVLDFSSIEKGSMNLESADVAIPSLLESACLPIRKAAAKKGLEFDCRVAGSVPEKITGDSRRICQILINLLGNAVKFTNQGTVGLHVEPSVAGGRSFLDFSVRDSGPGIQPGLLGSLFKPFTQADSTLSRQFQGAGLGLAISQRLAEAMGGTISVESTPDKGSTFTLRLPMDPHGPAGLAAVPFHSSGLEKTSALTDQHPPARTAGTHGAGGLVLVVEDDPDNSKLAGKMLNALGYRAEFASNGQEAVQAYGLGQFHAILMDMQMPVMNGLDATKKIREIEEDSGRHVPIIALTANVMPGDRDRCLAAGMDDFLSKPFNKAGLAAKLSCVPPGA